MSRNNSRLFRLSVIFPEDTLVSPSCGGCGERVTVLPDGSATHSDGEPLGPDEIVWDLNPEWEPADWLSDPDKREDWMERFGDARFFWPKSDKIYFTRDTARKRAKLLESYGATVTVVESEPIVWLTPERIRQNRIKSLQNEIDALQAIDSVSQEA